MPRPFPARQRLALQPLEDRVVPAFTLTINGDAATSGVSNDFANGITTFTATANGATLDVDDIEAALTVGDVLITTGSGGSQAGNIHWDSNSAADDLDYLDPAVRTLTIQPHGSSTSGAVTTDLVRLNFNDNVDLLIDTTAPATDGAILLVNDTQINFAHSVTLNAGTGITALNSASLDPMAASGDVTITAGSFQNTDGTFTLRADQGDVTFNAPLDVSNGLAVRAELGSVALNGPVNQAGDLVLYGSDIAINAPVGAVTPPTTLTFAGGNVSFGANAIDASVIFVGDASFDPFEAVFGAGSGTVTGDVVVQFDGDIAPGGAGTVGTLNITGSLTFDGGDYALDLGATSDKVVVDGSVDITFGRLGTETSTGALTASTDVQVISLTGALTGEFFNAQLDFPLVLGGDAIQVTNYGSAPTGLTIAQAPGAPAGTVTGVEIDGTAYTIKLTGGGQLVVFNEFGQLSVVTRGTTPLSRVTVSTRPNASDDLIFLGPVRINGPLAAFAAPKVNLAGDFTASGPVKALTFANAFTPIRLGGSATDKTTIKAENFFSPLDTPGVVTALTTKSDFGSSVTANAIGRLKVGGNIFAFGQTIVVTNGITAITATRVDGLDLTAGFIGTLTVTGNLVKHVAGDIANSVIRATGNDGSTGKFGLKTLTVKGNVTDSTILIEEGNVGSVNVGRFLSSQLFLDYTPSDPFNGGGTFDSTANFKLAKFTTTAITQGDPFGPAGWGFADSQVVADTIGIVRLTGVRTINFGEAFGFKFRTAGGSVQTKTSDDAAIALNANLTPVGGALAGDFYFLDV
jgi:hypothetical protein